MKALMKCILFVLVTSLPLSDAAAQTRCSAQALHGTWRQCGVAWVPDHYEHPPATINADSLRTALYDYNAAHITWLFQNDGSYVRNFPGGKSTGRFRVRENNCDLWLSTRRKDLIRILYLDDSCMIFWHNNPKTAYLTLYRR